MSGYLLNHCRRCFAIQKRLFVYDNPQFETSNSSGIRATIFGASGFLGKTIAGRLGAIGSQLTMPISDEVHYRHSEQMRELKLAGQTNKCWVQWGMDFRDQRMIERMIDNSNVVINLVGARKSYRRRDQFQFSNIEVAERIARACAKKGVHRLIHFSAAGASPDSTSLDFQTKWQAEDVVRQTFPNATIMRPCPMFGYNDYFVSTILRQSYFFFNKMIPVYDDCTALKQPIKDMDVAAAVLNALKMEGSKGETYELGGPNKLSMLEVYEIVFNLIKWYPKLAYINPEIPMKIAKHIYNWEFFGQEVIKKKKIEQVVKPGYKTIADLYVEPVTLKSGIYNMSVEYINEFRELDEDEEN